MRNGFRFSLIEQPGKVMNQDYAISGVSHARNVTEADRQLISFGDSLGGNVLQPKGRIDSQADQAATGPANDQLIRNFDGARGLIEALTSVHDRDDGAAQVYYALDDVGCARQRGYGYCTKDFTHRASA